MNKTQNITDLYPIDASGTKFDPAIFNILDEDAQPQLSQKGNFCRYREGNENTPELIERFHAKLGDATKEAASDPINDALADITDDTEVDLEQQVAKENVVAAESAEDIEDEDPLDLEAPIIEDPVTDDDSDDIMAEAEQGRIADQYKGNIDVEMILASCDASRKSRAKPRELPNFSNGGDSSNGYRGNGYNMQGVQLVNQDLRAAIFNDCDLKGANLSASNLEGARFMGSDIEGAVFTGCNLRFAMLPANFRNLAVYDNEEQIRKAYIEGEY